MKKFLISVAVIFLISMGFGFLVHGYLLTNDYMALPNLMRSQEESCSYFIYMILAHVFFSVGFVWIYGKGKENKPFLAQGFKFGLAAAALAVVPLYLIYYAVQPLPAILVVKQIIFDTVGTLCLGVVVAALNK